MGPPRFIFTASIAASLLGGATPIAAQSLDALRAGPAPRGESSVPAGLRLPSLPPQCQYWIGGGMLVGGTAALVAGLVWLKRNESHLGLAAAAAPIAVMFEMLGGAAGGALVGYVSCAVYYSVRPPSENDAVSQWTPLAPTTRFGVVALPP